MNCIRICFKTTICIIVSLSLICFLMPKNALTNCSNPCHRPEDDIICKEVNGKLLLDTFNGTANVFIGTKGPYDEKYEFGGPYVRDLKISPVITFSKKGLSLILEFWAKGYNPVFVMIPHHILNSPIQRRIKKGANIKDGEVFVNLGPLTEAEFSYEVLKYENGVFQIEGELTWTRYNEKSGISYGEIHIFNVSSTSSLESLPNLTIVVDRDVRGMKLTEGLRTEWDNIEGRKDLSQLPKDLTFNVNNGISNLQMMYDVGKDDNNPFVSALKFIDRAGDTFFDHFSHFLNGAPLPITEPYEIEHYTYLNSNYVGETIYNSDPGTAVLIGKGYVNFDNVYSRGPVVILDAHYMGKIYSETGVYVYMDLKSLKPDDLRSTPIYLPKGMELEPVPKWIDVEYVELEDEKSSG